MAYPAAVVVAVVVGVGAVVGAVVAVAVAVGVVVGAVVAVGVAVGVAVVVVVAVGVGAVVGAVVAVVVVVARRGEMSPDPEPCPECGGRCCRNQDYGYMVEHMGAECYEHTCDFCSDGNKYEAPLGLYLLTQSVNRGYDTYDSCIVVAENEGAARRIHPSGSEYEYQESGGWGRKSRGGDYWLDDHAWARPDAVTVTRIGTADASIPAGSVVLASFNAG